jgi:DNA topoisomerase-1
MGTFIKFGKGMFKIPKKEDGSKYEAEELQTVSLDEVKNGLLIKIKQLLLKRKNLRQRKQLLKNLQRRRNKFFTQCRKGFTQ